MTQHTNLWRHADFLALWSSQTLAALSAQITQFALPLIAALTLQASPFEMGLLVTMATLPNLLVGLFAGSWVDHMRRRPLMIAADITRAALLVSIPIASVFNLLTLAQLYSVLFLFGIGTTVFDVANVSYLPVLVGRPHVLEANSRIVASTSFAGAVGPGLAGVLVQLITAPMAILVDAVSLVLSAALLNTIRFEETDPASYDDSTSLWTDIAIGLQTLYGEPLLRFITGSSMLYLFFNNIMVAVYVLYAIRELAIAPAALGVIYALGGVGAILGAIIAIPIAQRLGIGYTLIIANLIGGFFLLLVPMAKAIPIAAIVVLGVAQCASQMMGAVFYISQTSLRQMLTPDPMLGRVSASYRFLTMGMIPLGALLGGILGETVGLRHTVTVGVIGMLLPSLWLVCSPIRTVHTVNNDSAPS
ncbi:MAG: MFS transporter [Caldilineaceae bacterium]|nr:MFS transporter [Caldilineaceae bacterium]